MSRELFGFEKGLRHFEENGNSLYEILAGSALPGGDGAEQDAAPISSLYIRQNGSNSTIYQKIASSNNTSDWQENGSSTIEIGTFRPERVIAVTNDTVTAGVARDLAASPFADDDGTLLTASDFQVGEFLIADADGTPVLLEVTNVSAPNITFSTPSSAPVLAQDDTFIARNYLPDNPGDKEGQAIVNYNGSVMVKIGDVDWNFADGINMASGYSAGSGDVSDADTVQSAIEKVDGNNDAQDTLIGTSQGDTDLGTFAGSTITDNATVKGALGELESAYEETDENVDDLITLSGMPENSEDLGTFSGAVITDNTTVKNALQELETFAESEASDQDEIDQNVDDLITLSGMPENSTDLGTFNGDLLADNLTNKSALQRLEDLLDELKMLEVTGVTTQVSVDEVPVADYPSCKWLVEGFEEATPGNKKALEIYALNDGTNVDDTVYAKLKLGANFNLDISVDISGGNMRLRAESSTAGVTVRARRIGVLDI